MATATEISEDLKNSSLDAKKGLKRKLLFEINPEELFLSKTVSEFGSLDILINNAGMHERGDFYNLSVDDIGKMVDVNLRAPMILSSMALPHMRSAGSGSIVMIASLAGMSPLQGAAIYSSTKAGLRAFGFALYELNSAAQNALLRDFTSFFVATFLFSILGVITLNPVWFFSAGIIYIGAGIFNLVAIYAHGTDFNQIFVGEFVLGSWPIALGLVINHQQKKLKE